MKRILYITILFFSFSSVAQHKEFGELGPLRSGVINDSDGYVNIRQHKTSSSQIIGRIEKNEEFEFILPQKENEKWVVVKTNQEKTGYVFFNRVYELRKNKCNDQIELIDQAWNKINGNSGFRTIDSIQPNLRSITIEITNNHKKHIQKLIACSMIDSEVSSPSILITTPKVTQKTYTTDQNITLIVSDYVDAYKESIGTVVSILEDGAMESYLYQGYLETLSIYALKKVNGNYKLYGNLMSSPGDYYGGNFTLEFINKSWVYKFEYYEFNG